MRRSPHLSSMRNTSPKLDPHQWAQLYDAYTMCAEVDAGASDRAGTHFELMALLQNFGHPVRTWQEAEQTAEELLDRDQ